MLQGTSKAKGDIQHHADTAWHAPNFMQIQPGMLPVSCNLVKLSALFSKEANTT